MALEAVVYPQDPLSYGCKDNYSYSLVGGASGDDIGAWTIHDYGFQASEDKQSNVNNNSSVGVMNNNNIFEQSINANWDSSSSSPDPSMLQNVKDQWDSHSSSSPESLSGVPPCSSVCDDGVATTMGMSTGRRKRRRTKSVKNKEEMENQRMTHIAVERNRRKQMNEYLAVLRSLMPPSYVQRGDQASIIGGAINFVKALEQLLQCIKAQNKTNYHHHQQQQPHHDENHDDDTPFAEFFMFPQYSTRATHCNNTVYPATSEVMMMQKQNKSLAVADIEVSLVDSHANIKILSKKQPGLLLKLVLGMHTLGFTILHLNLSTAHDMVLISLTVKVEEGCQLNTVDEIAAAVNQLIRTIHEEADTFTSD